MNTPSTYAGCKAIKIQILIADDSDFNREITKSSLEQEGFIVSTAIDGNDAIQKSKQHNFHLIFMDCEMPITNGLEATKKIRALTKNGNKDIPILGFTSNQSNANKELCLQASMNDVIYKPKTGKQLKSIIKFWVNLG